LGESEMTEPVIEEPGEAIAEEFTDELSDEALDREGAESRSPCSAQCFCCGR